MENINFQILKAETLIDNALENLPVGIGYYLLKNKLQIIEPLYYQTAKKEYEEAGKQAAQQQQQLQQINRSQ